MTALAYKQKRFFFFFPNSLMIHSTRNFQVFLGHFNNVFSQSPLSFNEFLRTYFNREAFAYYSILTSVVAQNSSKYNYIEGSIRKCHDTQAIALTSHFFSLGDIRVELPKPQDCLKINQINVHRAFITIVKTE